MQEKCSWIEVYGWLDKIIKNEITNYLLMGENDSPCSVSTFKDLQAADACYHLHQEKE